MLRGDPSKDSNTYFAGCDKGEIRPRSLVPDNIIFDRKGNLWIATDGQPSSLKKE